MFSVHDYSYCITERISINGSVKYDAHELTCVICDHDTSFLRKINEVIINENYQVHLDWEKSLVLHPSGHSDPIFIFEYMGIPCFQIIHYELDLIKSIEDIQLFINVGVENIVVKSSYLSEFNKQKSTIDVLYNDIFSNEIISINSLEPFDVVIQGMRFGKFFEEVYPYGEAGQYDIPLPYWFSDYYGICISSKHKVGGYEYKLMLMGNLGSPGGRYLLANNGQILSPRVIEEYKLKSLLIHIDKKSVKSLSENEIEKYLDQYREVEFAIDSGVFSDELVFFIDCLKSKTHRVSFFIYEEKDEFISIQDDFSSSPYSQGLIESDFFLRDFSRLLSLDVSPRFSYDFTWVSNVSVYDVGESSYGIGYSYFQDGYSERDFIFEKTRRIRSSLPCYNCDVINACSVVVPYPITKDSFGSIINYSGKCLVKEKILNCV